MSDLHGLENSVDGLVEAYEKNLSMLDEIIALKDKRIAILLDQIETLKKFAGVE